MVLANTRRGIQDYCMSEDTEELSRIYVGPLQTRNNVRWKIPTKLLAELGRRTWISTMPLKSPRRQLSRTGRMTGHERRANRIKRPTFLKLI